MRDHKQQLLWCHPYDSHRQRGARDGAQSHQWEEEKSPLLLLHIPAKWPSTPWWAPGKRRATCQCETWLRKVAYPEKRTKQRFIQSVVLQKPSIISKWRGYLPNNKHIQQNMPAPDLSPISSHTDFTNREKYVFLPNTWQLLWLHQSSKPK